jgi:DNA-binding XRE family transcriptional regulator
MLWLCSFREVFKTYKVGRCLLQQRLDELGMTQQELANKVHMPKQQISDYANNRVTMSLKNAKNIASALRCHIDDLYEWIPIDPHEYKRKR